jgi:hypothetical protein
MWKQALTTTVQHYYIIGISHAGTVFSHFSITKSSGSKHVIFVFLTRSKSQLQLKQTALYSLLP